ncbi:MAG: hypothetical protein KAK01_01900, partial [Candidatus Marinimicrobia bacterium]|nr:hypothetical protein [Candidatus Neomarinimicrobiota bacterium]
GFLLVDGRVLVAFFLVDGRVLVGFFVAGRFFRVVAPEDLDWRVGVFLVVAFFVVEEGLFTGRFLLRPGVLSSCLVVLSWANKLPVSTGAPLSRISSTSKRINSLCNIPSIPR